MSGFVILGHQYATGGWMPTIGPTPLATVDSSLTRASILASYARANDRPHGTQLQYAIADRLLDTRLELTKEQA